MTLLNFEDLNLSYGTTPLLKNAHLTLKQGEKAALVGRNGAGKSTLLKIIAGEVAVDSGTLWHKPGLKISLLPQVLPAADDRTVREVVACGLAEQQALLAEFNQLIQAEPNAANLAKLEKVQQQLDATNAWAAEQQIDQILKRLHLDGSLPMSQLSGGWRRRVALAQALVSDPDLLLLDEPTNHLDIETIQWLEEQIISFAGAVLLITHDRTFMQNIAQRLLELDLGQITNWEGTYQNFLTFKEEQLDIEARHQAAFDKKLAQEEVWIRQGIKARRTRNEGRVRALKELRNQRAQRLERQGKAKIHLENAETSGKLVVQAESVNFSYQDRQIINNLNTFIERGNKIGLLGPNGAGKTTLLKLLLGELQPTSGTIKLGTKLEIAYFDQLRSQLEPEKTLLDNLAQGRSSVNINDREIHVISYLQDFLFTPDRARQPVSALSGGEQNRLLLAKLFAQPANLLVLDEPTNDLDLETLELLEELLLDFKGTILVVSHDRSFLDSVVTGVLAFEGDGQVKEYLGGYSDWLAQGGKLASLNSAAKPTANTKSAPETTEQKTTSTSTTKPAPAKKLSFNQQRELDALPELIDQLEQAIATQEDKVGQADFYQQEGQLVAQELQKLQDLQTQLEEKIERWAELEA